MGRGQKYQLEQVVNLLRQIEVAVANGKTTSQAAKEAGIVEQTYFPVAQGVWWASDGPGEAAERAGAGAGEREAEASGGKPEPGQPCVEGLRLGKLLSPERRRIAADHAQQTHGLTERRACRLADQPRGTQRYRAIGRKTKMHSRRRSSSLPASTAAMVSPDHGAAQAGRLAGGQGPRRAYLASRGAEGSTEAEAARPLVAQRRFVRAAQARARKPCMELRFCERTNTRWPKCTHPQPDRRAHARVPAGACGTPLVQCKGHLCAGQCHGAEGSSGTSSIRQWAGVRTKDLRKWLAKTGAETLYIEPGSPWENGYCESFNSKLRDEFLNGEIFYSMKELRVLAETLAVHYNTVRPHSSLGYRPPAPQAWLTTSMGHGEVETATRFPLLHAPDGGYLNSEIAALH